MYRQKEVFFSFKKKSNVGVWWPEEIEREGGFAAVDSLMDSKVSMTICCLCVLVTSD